jgi:hypothetical protein
MELPDWLNAPSKEIVRLTYRAFSIAYSSSHTFT